MERGLRAIADDPAAWSHACAGRFHMRDYQIEPARAIARSVIDGAGLQLAIVFSRQAGKDETLAQVIAWLLTRYQKTGGAAVFACPTLKPQAEISMNRARERLLGSPLTVRTTRSNDTTLSVGSASARYLSAEPSANVRGATASLLLVANEAQDIDPAIWDARFDPMAASTNATTVFLGTVWDATGLLHRQMKHLEQLEAEDGIRRVFRVDWKTVAKSLPAYGERVRARIAQLGASHPFIRTEYMLQELDGEEQLFSPARLAQLQGSHQRIRRKQDDSMYALLIDVAGSDETSSTVQRRSNDTKRDSTAITVVRIRVDRKPASYEVVDRRELTNVPISSAQVQIADLAENVWRARAIVVDATGLGQGVASYLLERFTSRTASTRIHVQPFTFTASSKSALGWDLIGLIDSGRLKEYAPDGDQLTRDLHNQFSLVEHEILPGPQKLLRWGVPQSKGHDDLVMSLALVSVLDEIDLRPRRAIGSTTDES